MSFADLGKKADDASQVVAGEATKVKGEFLGLSKATKYVVYGIILIAILALGSCMLKGCGADNHSAKASIQNVGTEYPAQQMQQPVIVQQNDPTSGVLTGMAIGYMMSNGQRYDGHNGYGDSHYRGPAQVTNNTTVINKAAPNVPAPVSPVANVPAKPLAAVAPVAAVVPAVVKVANPGDAAAEQIRKNDALKAELKAKQAARASAPISLSKPSAPKSSFSSFSKSVSSPTRSSSSSSGSRRR
jgi:hypothetical protein